MPIELRIQSGARAGLSESFDKSVISVGRHPMSDLRFDANIDLDVSTRHGEIRARDGRYAMHDARSTNGTFVNGERVPPGGSRDLHDNDVIAFGAQGPMVAVRITGPHFVSAPVIPITAAVAPPVLATSKSAVLSEPRRPTGERVALAVRQQTRTLRIAVVGIAVVLGGLAGGIFYNSARESATHNTEVRQLLAANEAIAKDFQTRLQGDTVLTNSLRRHNDSLTQAVRDARSAAQSAAAQQELLRSHDLQRKFVEMGLPAVREANDAAVALISTEIGAQPFEATGFSVSTSGLIITNRHVVVDAEGLRASKIGVKFANTRTWRRAHLVRLSDDPTIDLALLQIDDGGGPFPAIHSIANAMDTPVGSSIATIGYPLGTDLPMEGYGNEGAAKTSLTVGTVSKLVPGLLQIDAFASHGSSGSPVFDSHGHVIGVVWGGPKDGGGRIVFAVPSEDIKDLIKGTK